MIDENKLHKWQTEAYTEWNKTKQGIIVGCTGSGKTLFALYCMLKEKKSTIIIVPKIALMKQWKEEILKHLLVTEDKIGFFYGKEKNIKPITIGVLNSLRTEDISKFSMVVVDEIHNICSDENIKILEDINVDVRLGLTATLQREDLKHELVKKLIGEVVYSYDVGDAIKDDIISKFSIINVGVEMSIEEKRLYETKDVIIKEGMREFDYNFVNVVSLAKNFMNPLSRKARSLMKEISIRRLCYSNSNAKISKVVEIVKQNKGKKIIVFNEYIGMAEQIYERLIEEYCLVGIYHSKAKDLNVIKQFSEGKVNVLVAVKSLNEGLNVEDAEIGIIVSGNNVKRNTIQRLGRIVRKKESGSAVLYQLYCKFTKEATDVQKRSNTFKKCATEIIWF